MFYLVVFCIHLWIVTKEPEIGKKKSKTGVGRVVQKPAQQMGPWARMAAGDVFWSQDRFLPFGYFHLTLKCIGHTWRHVKSDPGLLSTGPETRERRQRVLGHESRSLFSFLLWRKCWDFLGILFDFGTGRSLLSKIPAIEAPPRPSMVFSALPGLHHLVLQRLTDLTP